ncbi:MAG: signal recognition particle protein [Nitrospirae bacterium]|nr:signal recognition particle protein [Nitrospirota bacterium]MBI3593489.1 signal recognition particle protein [Nitrospirota bacterium]
MLNELSDKLNAIFKKIRGVGVLREENITEALREVRLALLEADVHFKVVKGFVDSVKEKAIGQKVMESLTPGQQMIKIVYDELAQLLGGQQAKIPMSSRPPTRFMLVGLQGAGKTTTAGKLALFYKKEGKRVLLVPADPYRPAAKSQLEFLGKQIDVTVDSSDLNEPVLIVANAIKRAEREGFELVIIDTAGRLQMDEALMMELQEIKKLAQPDEILMVADGMIGQEAVKVVEGFHQRLGVTGIILTKMEGDARGGALLSMKQVTGMPVRFMGTGEKLEMLEFFYPDRMASRILGMGDVLSLIELAQENFDKSEAENVARKLQTNQFTLSDFKEQIKQFKKLGSIEKVLSMIPGAGQLKLKGDMAMPEKEFVRIEAIIDSMTLKERDNPGVINGSRRKRIAKGSGTSVQEINKLLKQFMEAKKMMKTLSGKGGARNLWRSISSMKG